MMRERRAFAPARFTGPVALLFAVLALRPAGARATQAQDHAVAVAALSDLRAAISEIVQADASYSTDRDVYRRASQRAVNALEGTHGLHFSAAAGTPGDEQGTIGRIDALLDRTGEPVWANALRGAETNVRVAVTHLLNAGGAHELMDYQIAISRALTHLEVAQGRPTQTGVLGGLEGALANTVLGVPGDATQVDGCAPATIAPAYGVHGGYVAWVSLPATLGAHKLAEDPGGVELAVHKGLIALHTAAAPIVAKSCATAAASVQPQPTDTTSSQAEASQGQPPAAQSPPTQSSQSQPSPSVAPQKQVTEPPSAADATSTQPAASQPSAEQESGSLPALYTEAQAKAGVGIFAEKCETCHGANLQGTAAPSVAGNDFLKTAKQDGWTVGTIRYLVFNLMPLNAAKSLTPQQYANVMAFLLASNCYPAGDTPFPTAKDPKLGDVKLGPVPGHPSGQNTLGVCKVG